MKLISKENEQVLVITDSGQKFLGLIKAFNSSNNTYFVVSENSKFQDYYPCKNIYGSESIEMIKFLIGY